ncbi:MAG: tetratricopeptide repeat protein [Gemmataceae bacterium]
MELWFGLPLDSPARAQGLVWRAQLRQLTGEHAAALADLKEAMTMEPHRKLPRLLFALFRQQEAPDESRVALGQLAAEHPVDASIQIAWAATLREAGRLAEAREVLARFPEYVPGVFLQARIALDMEKPAEAEPLLKRVLDATPRDADAHAAMSRCLRQLGRPAEAARHQDRFLEIEREKQVPK